MFSLQQLVEIMFGLIILAMFKQAGAERKQKQMKFEKYYQYCR